MNEEIINDLKNINISVYKDAFQKRCNISNIYEELSKIKNGYYKEQILKCRDCLNKGNIIEYKKQKKNLSAVTFSGIFKDSRKTEELINYSKVLVIDIDNVDNRHIENIKHELFSFDFVFSCWLSPSGSGIKVLIKLDSDSNYHKIAFDQVTEQIESISKLEIDKSGSDLTRLCFVSYDENLLLKSGAKIFQINTSLILVNESKVKNSTNKENIIEQNLTVLLFKANYYKTEGRNNSKDRDNIKKLIKYLSKKRKSITSTYNNWYRVALAISNTFTYDLGKEYFLTLCRLDGIDHNEDKSIHLLEYCYRNRKSKEINFATILYLAKEQGFIIKRKENTQNETLSSEARIQN